MKKIWFNLLIIVFIAGCDLDGFDTDKLSDEIELTSGIALPLAKANLTMADILSEETDFVKYYRDNQGNERIMLFEDNDSVAFIGLNDFLKLSSQNIDIPVPYASFAIQSEISSQVNIPISVPNATLKTAEINYSLNVSGSDLDYPIILSIGFPTETESLPIEIELEGNDSFSQNYTQRLKLTNNEIPLQISLKSSNGNVNSQQVGKIAIQLDNFSINYIKGSVGEIQVNVENGTYNFDFDIFNKFPDGIIFDDPKLKLLVNNSTPFDGLFNTQISGLIENDQSIDLLTPSVMSISACPFDKDLVSDTIVIDKNNSNFQDFLYEVPNKFTYKGDLTLNQGAKLNDEIELDDQSRIYMGYMVEIPLEVIINSTLEIDSIDLAENDILKDLINAKLEINSINGFPFDAEAVIDFYNASDDIITETIETNIIDAAGVDDNGIVTTKAEKKEVIELTSEQIEKLSSSDKLIIRLGLRSSDYDQNQPVVILTNNNLSVQIALKGQVSL